MVVISQKWYLVYCKSHSSTFFPPIKPRLRDGAYYFFSTPKGPPPPPPQKKKTKKKHSHQIPKSQIFFVDYLSCSSFTFFFSNFKKTYLRYRPMFFLHSFSVQVGQLLKKKFLTFSFQNSVSIISIVYTLHQD